MGKSNLGFLTIAIGHERYLRQAEILSLSLRRNMPGVPLAIVTDNDRLAASADVIVPPLSGIPVGVLQKAYLDQYTPFQETLFIDSDCIATRPFPNELEQIRKFEFTPAMEKFTALNGTDEYIDNLSEALKLVGGEQFPKFNGGIYFFRKGELSSSVFRIAREIHSDYRKYGIKAFDKSGPGEETVFALALAKLGMFDLYHDNGNLMRTPTGLKGKISIEPLGGGCTFERYDGVVSPAICHFAGPYLFSPEYRLAAYSLTNNVSIKDIDFRTRASAQFASIIDRTKKYLEYKIHGVKKRLRPQFARWAFNR
ncbi:hypothetical protein SAMN05444159_1693 [Bradyrhizobium lablabi]|uniref:Uncharacterized protein n=1 Tax=Bradyrhizobium lablabi TaxID=722472 RepID=A0A1M6MPS2_9BRAD|nr:hypothetical protein [Bradyrhizobium lablabi]SHJ85442.1 hypothetical protein SAMN05444159_1693 [Bradyrhizobium lablabi]